MGMRWRRVAFRAFRHFFHQIASASDLTVIALSLTGLLGEALWETVNPRKSQNHCKNKENRVPECSHGCTSSSEERENSVHFYFAASIFSMRSIV